MRTGLTVEDLGDFLELPIVAVLATYRADGTVMLSPVWHEWRDGAFSVWTGGATEGKIRHLQADPRASLVVAEQVLPYRGIEASGTATLSSEPFYEVLRRTAVRYAGPDKADAMVAGYKEAGLVIRLVPDKVRIWDFKDEAPE